MRLLRLRVRTLMVLVAFVALSICGARLGSRSYDYHRLAEDYGEKERGWRSAFARGELDPAFSSRCVDYFEQLARKYRRAAWRPWLPVAPDPHAPGYDEWVEQERRAKEAGHGSAASGVGPSPIR